MTRPIITIFNVETQETIVREMNDAEFSLHEGALAETATRAAEAEAKATAKAALLTQLGITEEQAKLLLS
jgi:hypothetical protein